ncbi:hypothetical protein SAMN05444274_101245 [Mariniphaga anaerophila]|uniref:DUF3137 domain-containing protein n=1 Tax=Mariniphaga anaerophila TaxID=1484053 RepID=A0A1M4T3E6_9BACT|nr:SdpI family protein [Mariniphaga anaerophila]SHE38960.1 hypothetical protein SAMN05444274_101245 [Mariniphaga anaerophila]
MDKKQQIQEYFDAPKPKFRVKLFLLGIVAIVVGAVIEKSTVTPVLIIVGLLIAVIPILKFFKAKKRYEARPADSQMDEWFWEDTKSIIEKDALDKVGVDKEDLVAESLVIPGPQFWRVSGFDIDDVKRRKGNDGFFRYSVWKIQIFLFTENFLGSYECDYNWLKNTSINESTNEFFYKDVVSVKTATASSAYTLKDGQRLEEAQQFILKLAGDEVSVITNDSTLKTSSEMSSRVDKAVQSIRTMLRQKKA